MSHQHDLPRAREHAPPGFPNANHDFQVQDAGLLRAAGTNIPFPTVSERKVNKTQVQTLFGPDGPLWDQMCLASLS